MVSPLMELKGRIDASNKAAANNRSKYPIQEQVTLIELWEQVDCECGPECFCKKHGCTFHWRIKPNLSVNEVINGFVRTYIDCEKHDAFFKCLKTNNVPSIRIREAVVIAKDLKENWDTFYSNALKSKSCILCDNYADNYWVRKFSDLTINMSIYHFKMLSVLLPDIAVPFDTRARTLIKKQFGLSNAETYSTLIVKLQSFYQAMIEKSNSTIDDLRMLDNPSIYFDFARQDMRLSKPGYDYGKGFLPLQRPFSRVLDKVFYRPDNQEFSDEITFGMNETARAFKIETNQIARSRNDIFDYGRIKGTANADKLFICLLKNIESEFDNKVPESFTIEEIIKKIPKECAGIVNNSSYNYALIALFGSQKGRDYFVYDNMDIQKQFTLEANNPNRDNYFWKKYLHSKVKLNPMR